MADEEKTGQRQWFSDKTKFFKMMEEIDAKAGIPSEPSMNVEELRKRLLARGIRPEDNLLSRDIIRHKYPDEEIDPMAVVPKPSANPQISDKTRFFERMEEIDAKAGIVFDPTMTGEKVQQILLDEGARPWEDSLSREIIRAKYPDEEEDQG